MAKYLPSIVAALVSLAGLFAPQLQGVISAHPQVSAVIAGLYAILAHFLPSPQSK